MKKLLTMFAMLMIGMSTTVVHAQTKKTTQVVTTTKSQHMKKDGTPDKRYKENKASTSTTVVGPTKKDGTADMRYKANKSTVKKTTTKPKN